MRLQEVMRSKVFTIDASQSADFAWSRMRRRRIRHLVVLDGSSLVGVVSERDLGGPNGDELRKGRLVEELMASKLVSAEPKTTLREAANLMRARKVGSLPILEGDRLVGIVTATDVLDELGRGSIRPAVRAPRRTLRLPAGHHDAGGRKVVRTPKSGVTKTGRARGRKPDSTKRAAFAGRRPKPEKRKAGRAEPPNVPAHIREVAAELTPDDRTYIRRKLGMKLGKFANSIERVSVRVEDVNGPRGGVDQVCRIKATLSGLPSVVFEAQDESLRAAVDGALTGIERAVRGALGRRRTKAVAEGRAPELLSVP